MFCVRCGAALPEGAAYCASCGAPVAAAAGGPGAPTPTPFPAPVAEAPHPAFGTEVYGGFWRRFWSYLIDRFVLGVAFTPVGILVFAPMVATESVDWTASDLPAEALGAFLGAVLTVAFLALLGSWLYYALLQSSSRQATLGQLALGIRITDLEGRRVSFARASGRYFAALLTGLTFGIGYLIMFLTTRKQSLHDLIAGTLVRR